MDTEHILKQAIDHGCTTVHKPVKFWLSSEELNKINNYQKDIDGSVVVEITQTGIGPIIKIGNDWDKPLEDITEYGCF